MISTSYYQQVHCVIYTTEEKLEMTVIFMRKIAKLQKLAAKKKKKSKYDIERVHQMIEC